MKILDSYRCQDGEADYCFSLEQEPDGNWRAYIVAQPDYGGMPDESHATHRMTADDGRRFVCWTDPVTSLDDMKAIAARWADETQNYIKGLPAFKKPHEN